MLTFQLALTYTSGMNDIDDLRTQMGLNGLHYFLQPNGMQGAVANKKGIVDPDQLAEIEYHMTSMVEVILRERMHLLAGKQRDQSAEDEMRDIHKKMFSPIYDWAGEYRTANVAKINPATKQLTQFAFVSALGNDPSRLKDGAIDAARKEFSARFAQIDNYLKLAAAGQAQAQAKQDPVAIKNNYVATIGMLFKNLNDLHPFPEGNGRATRLFLERHAIRNGFVLDFTKVPKSEWITASAAAVNKTSPNMTPIMSIFRQISSPIDESSMGAFKKKIETDSAVFRMNPPKMPSPA